jgi:anti-anti-sigma factor
MSSLESAPPQAAVVADGAGLRVDLAGDLDLAARELLDDALEKITAAPPSDVRVDLAAVTFLSSDALGFLARIRAHAQRGGFVVTLANPRRVALRAIQVSGFDQIFPVS